jgi:hypothetical protein
MKNIISIAVIGDYLEASPEAIDGVVRALRAAIAAHAQAYGLTNIEVSAQTWDGDSKSRQLLYPLERPA